MKVAEKSEYLVENQETKQNIMADIALEVTQIIEKESKVDWTNNPSIHNKIEQDIEDMIYEYEKKGKCKLSFEVIDMVIENVKTTALRRFKG